MNFLNWVTIKIGAALLWLCTQVPTALVSAIVGSIFGALTALAWNAYESSQQDKFFVIGDDSGVAFPAVLFENASKEGLTITFAPKNLKKIRICEYTHDRGRTWTELVYKYLKEYEDCFIVRRLGEDSLQISPNTFSGLLEEDTTTGEFRCKCV